VVAVDVGGDGKLGEEVDVNEKEEGHDTNPVVVTRTTRASTRISSRLKANKTASGGKDAPIKSKACAPPPYPATKEEQSASGRDKSKTSTTAQTKRTSRTKKV
jgi:hypothetical protein